MRKIIIEVEQLDGEMVKTVRVEINGKKINEFYSYPSTVDDNTITAEVNADLDDKGYPG